MYSKILFKKAIYFQIIINIVLSYSAVASLYEKKCNKKSGLDQIGIVCQNTIGFLLYDTGQLWFEPDPSVKRMRRQEEAFLIGLKREKLRYLKGNYNQLLGYFWQSDKIRKSNFECSARYEIGERDFNRIPTKRRGELNDGEKIKTIERRKELTRNLIVYERALTEIDKTIDVFTYKCMKDAAFAPESFNVEIPSCTNLYEKNQRLRLAKYAILNNYPILDTDAWKEGVNKNKTIFNKPSDTNISESDINYVELHYVDKALSEIQDNLLLEAKETCSQSISDLVSNDFISERAIGDSVTFTNLYCDAYDSNEGGNILKTTGLVTASVIAVAAAPLSGGSSLLGLTPTIVGGGAVVLDIGIAFKDIDNYSDIKRKFLTRVAGDNEGLVSYEEKKSAYTQAIVSSALTGLGTAAQGIGIVRSFKGRRIASSTSDIAPSPTTNVVIPNPVSVDLKITEKAMQHIRGVFDKSTKKLQGGLHTEDGLQQFIKETGHKTVEDVVLNNGVRRVRFERDAFNKEAWHDTMMAAKHGNGAPGGKTIFPESWSDEKINEAIRSVSIPKNKITSQVNDWKEVYEGVYDGVRIRVACKANDKELVTAFPTWIQP